MHQKNGAATLKGKNVAGKRKNEGIATSGAENVARKKGKGKTVAVWGGKGGVGSGCGGSVRRARNNGWRQESSVAAEMSGRGRAEPGRRPERVAVHWVERSSGMASKAKRRSGEADGSGSGRKEERTEGGADGDGRGG